MGVGPSGPTSRSAGGGAAVHRETTAARPVLKWAGGKSQLLETFLHCYPAGLSTGGIRRYMEPFVGSGAVLFDVAARFLLDEYVIVDRNPHLIRTYQVIRDQAPALIERLSAWQELYWSMGSRDREGFYYAIRDRFNAGQDPPLDEAVALIFLNRTCFNDIRTRGSDRPQVYGLTVVDMSTTRSSACSSLVSDTRSCRPRVTRPCPTFCR
ncbi:MAG: DNA adenine methylase [Firmicutes bacterium]|nr:DNA adenine methylase [Bacillota bacterium]